MRHRPTVHTAPQEDKYEYGIKVGKEEPVKKKQTKTKQKSKTWETPV